MCEHLSVSVIFKVLNKQTLMIANEAVTHLALPICSTWT